ncbi:hypothetical protein Ae201684P_011673 [Aphanomyces euteiches]|uniref:PCI domain-containing protein n=1 Tax=Aphanomyces euteiches TaxID=100861 RepID=A0A6G0WUJ9_9STRA|nr:hypothetical protein Ae201684_011439 [Aphanomyces euteiches]KAH9096939.1 hypothetical protein Ae201684P_011673 [Aphanomyces euteiches]
MADLGGLVKDLEGCLQRQECQRAAQLLAISYRNSTEIFESEAAIESLCQRTFSGGYAEVMAPLLKAKKLVQQQQYVRAYESQIAGFIPFLEIFRDQTNWLVPLLQQLTYDTRILAQHADSELSQKRGVEVTESLENAEQHLKKGFSMTINDRASPELSKKPATLYIVNQLFKIYFRLNKISLCSNIIQAINKQNFEQFEMRDQVTYKYYLGRIRMFEDKYNDANECLSFAWQHCHKHHAKNKRMILQYLVPVKLVLGVLPSPELLREYRLDEYNPIASAIKRGDLLAFNQSLHLHQAKFIAQGMYLLMQKLRLLVMRTLLKKVYLIQQKNAKLKLTDFQIALEFAGASIDMDALECIVANLIFKRYIKGFISRKHGLLVLSKSNAFPAIGNAN